MSVCVTKRHRGRIQTWDFEDLDQAIAFATEIKQFGRVNVYKDYKTEWQNEFAKRNQDEKGLKGSQYRNSSDTYITMFVVEYKNEPTCLWDDLYYPKHLQLKKDGFHHSIDRIRDLSAEIGRDIKAGVYVLPGIVSNDQFLSLKDKNRCCIGVSRY
jgi:hypothetical protein